MNTNASPKRVAALSALFVALIPGVLSLLVVRELWLAPILFFLTWGLGYIIVNYLLERFIYRKIKVIYKNIHSANTNYLNQNDGGDPITMVSDDVSAWAQERNDEIAQLKEQEGFRREFLGNVSHELKTPIFQIQGYIHTLLEGALSDPKVNYNFLEKASQSADRLVELVDDLTSINRLESGKMKMDYSTFQVLELVEEVYEELDFMYEPKEITCSFKQSADVNLKVSADRKKIKQVLVNLVVNAVKYGKNGGTISCGIYDMDKNILVEISDNGEGIPPDSLPRLFERFYRVEQSRTRNLGGSGLGLAIAKHIIEAHGHTIKVRSDLGVGSTFGFTLSKG